MRSMIKSGAAAIALVVAVGCGGELHPGWQEPLAPEGPAMMSEAMIFLDRGFEEIIIVRPGLENEQPRLETQRVPTGQRPSQMAVSANGEQLYVLNDGDRTLSVFDIDGESVERQDVTLDSPYDVINVDPEGEFVLLSNSGRIRDDVVVQNLNELGIVDLRGGISAESQAHFMSLPTRAQNLQFLPPFEMGGETQRLVVALAENQVTLVDLNAQDAFDEWRRIRLIVNEGDTPRNPTEVVFDLSPGEEGSPDKISLFVLTDRDRDVMEISVQMSTRADEHRKFNISVNQLAAGDRPGRIAVLDLPQGRRLLALDAHAPRFTLVDVSSGESSTFDLPMSVPARNLLVYSAQVPGQTQSEQRVLVSSSQSKLVAIIRPEAISVGSETPSLGQTVQAINMQSAPSSVLMESTVDQDRAVALHAGGQDGFTILNLPTLSATSIQGLTLSGVIFDSRSAYGVFQNSPHMVRVDMQTGHTRTFELPGRARALYLSPDREILMARHDGSGGRFSVFPVASPTPEKGRLYEHVFLQEILSQPAYVDSE